MNNELLIITGTQRSGTSFMAKFFEQCGFDLGTVFWDDRVDGGLESPDICNYYRQAVGDPDFPFHGYWNMIERDAFHSFEQLHKRFRVLKFSYLLSNPIFLNKWIEKRGHCNDRLLIMHRPLEDVFKSRQTKPEFDAEDSKLLPRTLEEMRINWIDSLMLISKHNIPHFVVPFPRENGYEIVPRIRANISLSLPRNAPQIYNNLFNPDKVQFK